MVHLLLIFYDLFDCKKLGTSCKKLLQQRKKPLRYDDPTQINISFESSSTIRDTHVVAYTYRTTWTLLNFKSKR